MSRPATRLHKLFEGDSGLLGWVDTADMIVRYMVKVAGIPEESAWSALTHWNASPDLNEDTLIRALSGTDQTDLRMMLDYASSLPPPPVIGLHRRKSDQWIDFTFMDLFAGIGGFHLALESQGGSLVFASEWDSSARLTYLANHGVYPHGDIRGFTREQDGSPLPLRDIRRRVPRADVIAAGFPCQPFSKAGVSSRNHHGLEHGLLCEAQGTLFEDILLLARATGPDALVLENVGNLRFHDKGNTIRVILNEIDAAGYTVYPHWDDSSQWAVLDSSSFSAQRRRRVYLVCIRKDLADERRHSKGPFELTGPRDGRGARTLREVIDMDDSLSEAQKFEHYGISRRMWASHLRRESDHRHKGNGFRIGLMTDLNVKAPTLVARYYKDGKDCLVPSRKAGAPPRMLTPRECATLQTFPSSFRIPSSKSSAYRQFGNAVTVEVARWVSRQVIEYLYG